MNTLHTVKLKANLVYYLMGATGSLAGAIMFTTYTVFFYKMVGLNPLQLVLVGTVLETTALLFEVPTGIVADTYSRRLSIIIGMLILGAGFAMMGIFPLFAIVILGQVITGIGYTFLSGATDAWLADEVGEINVGPIYIRSRQIERVTGLAGIGLGVGLASLGLNLPFILGGSLYLALGLLLILVMQETNFHPAKDDEATGKRLPLADMAATFKAGFKVIRGNQVLIALIGAAAFTGAASEGFDRLGDAHLLANFTFPALGALQPVVWFGILNAAGSLLSLAATEGLRKRLEKISQNPAATARTLLILNLVMIAAVVGFGLAGNFAMAFGALMIKALAGSLGWPLYDAWLVQHTESKTRATVLSMFGQSNALGQIAGGPGVGWIGTQSLRAAIVVTGLLSAPITVLYAWVNRVHKAEPDDSLTESPVLTEEPGFETLETNL